MVDGIVHYCVANMPGAVGRTSTYALCNVTFPYVLRIANSGLHEACRRDAGLAAAVNMIEGRITNEAVADTFGLPFVAYSGQALM
jgi:alanine dehydrogenase